MKSRKRGNELKEWEKKIQERLNGDHEECGDWCDKTTTLLKHPTDLRLSRTFLIVGQKKFFKHPIGYFLINKIDAKQQEEMVKEALSRSDAGFNNVSIVCDGAFSKQATATYLSCSLTSDNIKTEINHPLQDEEAKMMFDACHLIKLVRNCLAAYEDILSEFSGISSERRSDTAQLDHYVQLVMASASNLTTKKTKPHQSKISMEKALGKSEDCTSERMC
ncbi:THAP domain-containing protein 9 [Elysia marginata]|uniref:THAP domain-containing protein 9 n=1 Tax=Elysia marginata TaxID=1093978 RepID=A0AAV4I9P6_9GAST|nr:THAP domain-containing protein 9 [Elysia marginata]